MSTNMEKALAVTAKQIAAIDVTDTNRRIATLEAEKAEFEAAIARAESRCTGIAIAINEGATLDGRPVADELLADGDVMQAARLAPGLDQLRTEKDSLRAGIAELRGRIKTASAEIATIREGVGDQKRAAVKPLALALREEAVVAIEHLLEIFAASEAINWGTRSPDALLIANVLRLALPPAIGATGVPGLRDGLVAHRESLDVPRDVLDALAGLERLGAAHELNVPKSVARPW